MSDYKQGRAHPKDRIPVNPNQPAQIKFCGWLHRQWGWVCYCNGSMAQFVWNRHQDGDDPIFYNKAWVSIEDFKAKKLAEFEKLNSEATK